MTYSDVLRPRRAFPAAAYDATLIVLGAVLVALMARIAIYTPFSPVPITGQTFAVLLVAALLGAKRGTASMAAYFAAGLMGLPVFASGAVGPAILAGPTLGYLIGFMVAAAVVGTLAEKGWDENVWKTVAIMVIGNAAIYLCGVAWLAVGLNVPNAISVGVVPFLIGDALKIALAAILLPGGWAALRQFAPEFAQSSVDTTP